MAELKALLENLNSTQNWCAGNITPLIDLATWKGSYT